MTESQLNRIQNACIKLREAIEEGAMTKRVFISWCVIDDSEENNFASGITMGDGLSDTDAIHCLFKINGRAYKMIHND